MPEVFSLQPVAVITSPAEGLVYINGRLAGETGPVAPLALPVNPSGTLYFELRPFSRRWRDGAHRLRFAGGVPEHESVGDACRVIIWPGGVCEIALMPLPAHPPESEYGVLDGIPVAVLRGEGAMLRAGGGLVALPEGAALPDSHISTEALEIFTGSAPGKRYMAVFTRELAPLNSITATTLSPMAGLEYAAVTMLDDTAGHARRERVTLTPGGAVVTSSALSPTRRPVSPEETALAAVEALLLGEAGEASAYMTLEAAGKLDPLLEGCGAAAPVKYAPPDPRPAIALIKPLNSSAARAEIIHYSARPTDKGWLITDIERSSHAKGRRV